MNVFHSILTFSLCVIVANAFKNEKFCDFETAKAFGDSIFGAIGRSVTTSTVLTVNVKNAIILSVIKAIVIIAGLLGKFSFWTFPNLGSGRKLDSLEKDVSNEILTSLLSDEDIRWMYTYMWALNKKDFQCLYKLACENPYSANIYAEAATILRDILKFLRLIQRKSFYENLLKNVEEAASVGLKSRRTCATYKCIAPFHQRG